MLLPTAIIALPSVPRFSPVPIPPIARPFPRHSSIFYQRNPIFCQKTLHFKIFLLLLLPESHRQRNRNRISSITGRNKGKKEAGIPTAPAILHSSFIILH